MDNEGGIDPNAAPMMSGLDGGDNQMGQDGVNMDGLAGGNDENVDQYFDDGGETFLPADHVSQHPPIRINLKCN